MATVATSVWLGLRSVAMTVLFPGTVAILFPYWILRPVVIPEIPAWSARHYLSSVFFAGGSGILLACVWEFARRGRGTLAPFDEPRALVVQGLYRYVRNPMYVGVLLILAAESWFFASSQLLIYTALWFGVVNLFVLFFEEPRLRSRFGTVYEDYCSSVGRWLPRVRDWKRRG
jgi:protein-S-isoprenylcysteine O-methyltransferase Ste14